MCCLGGQDAPSPMPESRNLGNLSLARLALPPRPLVLRLLFEQSVMCGELALQSGLSCNSIHSAMSDGAAQPGCQKERCDARLKGKYFRDSNSRPQHVLLARKHCLYSGFDNFNAIVIFIMIYIVYIMILEVH